MRAYTKKIEFRNQDVLLVVAEKVNLAIGQFVKVGFYFYYRGVTPAVRNFYLSTNANWRCIIDCYIETIETETKLKFSVVDSFVAFCQKFGDNNFNTTLGQACENSMAS